MIKEKVRNAIIKNASYFAIMILLGATGAFVLLSENNTYYESRANVVLLPRNIKTAIHLDTLRENVVDIFTSDQEKITGLVFDLKNESSLVNIEIKNSSKLTAVRLNQEITRDFITVISKYYDIKSDVEVRIANRSVLQKNKSAVARSLIIGFIIAIIAQLLIIIMEIVFERRTVIKISKDASTRTGQLLKNALRKNQEKIKNLSSSKNLTRKKEIKKDKTKKVNFQKNKREIAQTVTSIIARIKKNVKKKNENKKIFREDFVEFGSRFKKASSPKNLPTESIENRIDPQQILSSESTDFKKVPTTKQKVVTSESTKPASELPVEGEEGNSEPTEEEFKRRLNQLLRGDK